MKSPKSLTSFRHTGFPTSTRCTSRRRLPKAFKSESSARRFPSSTSVERFGIVLFRVGLTAVMRLRARRRVRRRGHSGKLVMAGMSLSVRSMASWSWEGQNVSHSSPFCRRVDRKQRPVYMSTIRLTFARPKFSMAGILCPK